MSKDEAQVASSDAPDAVKRSGYPMLGRSGFQVSGIRIVFRDGRGRVENPS